MVSKLISTITFSRKRENLLLLLRDGPRTLEEIRNALNVTSSGMIPQIRKLEEQKLVRQEGKSYLLTDTGVVVAEVFSSFVKTARIIEDHKDFWEEHNIRAIPSNLLKRIYDLGDCKLIESGLENMYEPHTEFFGNILNSKSLMGVAPVFHPLYPQFFLQLAQQNVRVFLILTKNVFDKVKREYRDSLQSFLECDNVNMSVIDDDVKLAFVVTDNFLSLSFFFKNGAFDAQRDLISFDKSALEWGKDLFSYYREQSEEIRSL